MAERNNTGKEGESEARAYLEKLGYQILHTNWHFHHYELDLVAVYDGELIVVEVKTRSVGCLLPPEEAVDRKKSDASLRLRMLISGISIIVFPFASILLQCRKKTDATQSKSISKMPFMPQYTELISGTRHVYPKIP